MNLLLIFLFHTYNGKGLAAICSKRSYSSSIDLSTIKADGCKEAICTLDQSEHQLNATYA